ncbi:SulP family inorganic anion transporter [Candidatus Woesearchaeota archaeon]|nr:SulP family inorganic anion transporter [Candidatus Woesearchaeota archaeon]
MDVTQIKTKVKEYFQDNFSSDLKAGFITAIVALPLAIAFAIASGVDPIMGLYTAIIAGILGSAFGGSVYSITGPTGAMTVVILSAVHKFGIEGLLLAGFLAGVFQLLFGFAKLGRFVKFIPMPVVTGFTAGIGAIIFIGQIANSLGLTIGSKEHVWETIIEIIKNIPNANPTAIIVTLFTIFCLLVLPKILHRIPYLRNLPASLFPLVLSTGAVIVLALAIPQVGAIPSGLPDFQLININWQLVKGVLPAAFTIALLGTIEALLCAVVCDGMTNTKHKSDKELVGQGIANVVLPFFGAIPATAAIARSAVNIREGAKTRFAGIIHALFLLLILLFFAPIAQYIPKAFLAGILMVVSVRMINMHEFRMVFKISRLETIVLLATFGFTVFTDLVFAVEVGMVLAAASIFVRLMDIIDITHMKDFEEPSGTAFVFRNEQLKKVVNVYTLHGPFFFGAMSVFDKKLDEHIENKKPITILRLKYVPFIDSTALIRLVDFIKQKKKHKGIVFLADLTPEIYKTLHHSKEFRETVKPSEIFPKTKDAITHVENNLHNILLENGAK